MQPARLLLPLLACFALLLTPSVAKAQTITVGGVGSMTPLIKALGAEFVKKQSGVEISVSEPPLGSSGGMRALAVGKIEIVLLGRLPNPEEGGEPYAWVRTPLILATSGGASKGLSRGEIADIYSARKTTWDDGKPIRLVLRGVKESETIDLRSISVDINAAVGAALTRTGLPIAENDLEALTMLGKIPGSLGTTTLGLITASEAKLSALPIDGVMPSLKAFEDGSYTLGRQYYVVTGKTTSAKAAQFVSFLKSPAALALARKLGYLPAKP